jgi:predicted DNA-binding transcriptional regulator YafY
MDLTLYKGNKSFRLLNMYERLNRGEALRKADLAAEFGVTLKTVQRDVDDLRAYLAETHFAEQEISIRYDRNENAYLLMRLEREWLTNTELLAICKILLDSRAFSKKEMTALIGKLLAQTLPAEKKNLEEFILSERHHYIPPHHGKDLLERLWELAQHIRHHEVIKIMYTPWSGKTAARTIRPVALTFSEFYFYLLGFMADGSKDMVTVFRVDRISSVTATGEKFRIPYRDQFNEGEFRKRVQFMMPGKLRRVRFTYRGESVEAVLDRLPTAEIEHEENGVYTIKAEVYGDGIDLWLRGQGDRVELN